MCEKRRKERRVGGRCRIGKNSEKEEEGERVRNKREEGERVREREREKEKKQNRE